MPYESPFQTKIIQCRFVLGPFSSEQMATIGEAVLESITDRIKRGMNCNDQPAKPLKGGTAGRPGYPEWKRKRGIEPIRNWISPREWPKGRLKVMQAMKVRSASQNEIVIGFIDPRAGYIAHINNLQERMFGMSPINKEMFARAVFVMHKQARLVRKVIVGRKGAA